MLDSLRVIGSALKTNDKDELIYEVYFDDHSIWICDYEGKNWKKAGFSLAELQKLFSERDRRLDL